MFQDDFEDGNLDRWVVIDGELSEWIVENGTCGRAVTSGRSPNSSVIVAGSDSWSDYRAEFDIGRLQGNQIHVVFRDTPDGDYRPYAPDLGRAEETIGLRDARFRSLCSEGPFVTGTGSWHHRAIECHGNPVTVLVNGSKVLECLDATNSAPSGRFAPGVYTGSDMVCEVEYDNIVITALDPAPSSTPTVPPTVTPAPSPGPPQIVLQ